MLYSFNFAIITVRMSNITLIVFPLIYSTQFSWYTDRTVVGLMYHATELHWVTDKSPGRVETWRFLERRLRESQNLRNFITDTYTGVMNFTDATAGSIATILRAARKSY